MEIWKKEKYTRKTNKFLVHNTCTCKHKVLVTTTIQKSITCTCTLYILYFLLQTCTAVHVYNTHRTCIYIYTCRVPLIIESVVRDVSEAMSVSIRWSSRHGLRLSSSNTTPSAPTFSAPRTTAAVRSADGFSPSERTPKTEQLDNVKINNY